MTNNVYVYIIILFGLLGSMSSLLCYNLSKEAQEKLETNRVDMKGVEARANDLTTKLKTLGEKQSERIKLRNESRVLASSILAADRELKRASLHRGWYERGVEFHAARSDRLSGQVASVQDAMREEISNVERTQQEMETYYKSAGEDMGHRMDGLKHREEENLKTKTFETAKIESEVKNYEIKINREHQVVYNRFATPEGVGRILEVLHGEHKIILDVGSAAGVKRNFKFKVFNLAPDGEVVDKGFAVVKSVSDMYAVAALLYDDPKREPVLPGDRVGSPAYTQGGRRFFLAGKFDTKFNKAQLTSYLQYMGNLVVEELSPSVDMVVEGKFSEMQVAQAATMGILIIREDQLVPFLGD